MTGVSSPPRASSSTRPARRLAAGRGTGARYSRARLSGASVVVLAFAAAACQSELADGNPEKENPGSVPVFDSNGNVIPNASGTPNGVVTGNGGDGRLPPVGSVMNSQGNRNPSISGTGDTAPLTDPLGNPLAVADLPALQACSTPGPQLIRRLTSEQYRNTLVSVFGEGVPNSNPLRDATTLGYNVDADDSLVEGLDAQSIMNLAEDIATFAQGNGMIAQLANNCTNLNDNNCRQTFVRNLGEKLSREPLDQQRVERFAGLFTEQGPNGEKLVNTFDEGAGMVIAAMVQSPFLIYRREIGKQQNGEFVLSPFEVASELSYMLTDAPPDDTLIQAAKSNQLSSPEQIQAQADRLLATTEAEDVLSGFVTAWLDVDRLKGKVKSGVDISPELREDMLEETRRLFLDVFDNGGAIGDLFSATYTFLNQPLASFYGVEGATSPDFTEVDISDGRRVRGVLGHGSYLAAHALADNSSPVQRAFVVRERLLCNDLPEVPTDLDTNLDPPDPNGTSRERYSQHSSNPVCYNCHQLMDPIGFTFENYDGYGRFRATEANKPVDSSGGLPLMDANGPTGVVVPLANVNDLATHLASSESARACLVNNLSYYAYGVANNNKWAPTEKVCTDHFIRQVARDSGNTLKSVLTGILRAPHFTRRVQSK